MRLPLHALLGLLLLLPGCLGTTDEPTPDPETTAASADASAVAPFEGVRLEHDFQAEPEVLTFDVPRGTGPVDFTAYFRGGTGDTVEVCRAQDARIVITNPSGGVFWEGAAGDSLAVGSPSGGGRCGQMVQNAGLRLEAGTYEVSFEGSGIVVGVVEVLPQT